MKLTGYTKTWRPAMSAETLVRLFGRWPDRDESIPALAGALEDFEPDELAGLVADASKIAASLGDRPGVRRLAACVAIVAESVLRDGLADWDAVHDLIERDTP